MKIWGATDVGRVREANEDTYLTAWDEEQQKAVCVICDGMGGANAGGVASKTALDAFAEKLIKDGKPSFSAANLDDQLVEAVRYANGRVYELADGHPEYEGMGTTLVCMLRVGDAVSVGNVGDSRAYLIHGDGIQQITRDHSLVWEMVRRGEITEAEARRHPIRNVITRVLGPEREIDCDTFHAAAREGTYLLLCSDGLTGEVSEPEIFDAVMNCDRPEDVCQTLMDLANARGGHDNISVILVAF